MVQEKNKYNLYFDESCHLQYDNSDVMCIGGIVVPAEKIQEYKDAIKAIKRKYAILHEIKWNTISTTRINMYKELLEFFFSSQMSFRCILIKNKSNISAHTLNRIEYNEFYFSIVEKLIRFSVRHNGGNNNDFRVYLDLKDSHGAKKLRAIENVLHGGLENNNEVSHLQNIRSHESVFIQLADILIGAIAYKTRKLKGSEAKLQLIEHIEKLSGYSIDEGTEPGDAKFSIYDFQPKKRNG